MEKLNFKDVLNSDEEFDKEIGKILEFAHKQKWKLFTCGCEDACVLVPMYNSDTKSKALYLSCDEHLDEEEEIDEDEDN